MTDNLPTLRKKMGITQEGLAEKYGVSRSTIATIERKRKQ
jgi:DNA-binding XRE family transcriptional regulator